MQLIIRFHEPSEILTVAATFGETSLPVVHFGGYTDVRLDSD